MIINTGIFIYIVLLMVTMTLEIITNNLINSPNRWQTTIQIKPIKREKMNYQSIHILAIFDLLSCRIKLLDEVSRTKKWV